MGDKNVLESTGIGDRKSQPISENMKLLGGDHPGMSLVSVPLDGNNYFPWEIAEAFLYATSTRDMWLDLASRFGESNGPLLYQIQREIASMTQGNMFVAVYFTKLKKLWDELASLDPIPSCSYGAGKKISEKTASNQLLQFLMGLSDAYDHEPKNFSEAQERQEWKKAMQQEINALERNETWEISDLVSTMDGPIFTA
ncbi:UNVERIFIED_CONTAM: hypothetical protein Slati_4544300 [Sesamum latifolium]|uniref:Retrotransposon Copia-like N-terminal domain-containing protein n=1 Tax=Sesamum latifolium TaxID=2727402 RepID=A0AAW2S4K4_9LAMI